MNSLPLNPNDVRTFVEHHFGSDDAIGVWFCGEEDGARYSAKEADELFECLGTDCPPMMSMMPDGSSATVCTNYAIHVGKKLPDRTQIFGFSNIDNPSSRVAREEIHPGGHDFALVDCRYLVDPWIRLVACESDQIIFDLDNDHDAAIVQDVYGPRECWRRMYLTEEEFRPAKQQENTRDRDAEVPAMDF
jgi:hypothetical protein